MRFEVVTHSFRAFMFCHFEGIQCHKCARNHSPTNTASYVRRPESSMSVGIVQIVVFRILTPLCWSLMLVFWMNVLLPSSGLKELVPRGWWSGEYGTADDVETHVIISVKVQKYFGVGEYLIYLLTVVGLTCGGSSTVHIYTRNTHNTIKENTQNRTYITVRIHKPNKKNT